MLTHNRLAPKTLTRASTFGLDAPGRRASRLGLARDYVPRPRGTVAERFQLNFLPEPNSGCWLWTGSVDGVGYGRMKTVAKGQYRPATHISWEIHRGEVPAGMMLGHRCDVPSCVNPNHLFVGTARDNNHDMMRKGRFNPWNRGLTHCRRGHERTAATTYVSKGHTSCRVCWKLYDQVRS